MILFSLIFAFISNAQAVACKDTRPKLVYVSPQEKNFCLNFLPGYLDSMKGPEAITVTYKGASKTQSKSISYKNKFMKLFELAQVSIESGWASRMARENNNHWGLGGNFTRADGSSTFMNFKNFEQGHAFFINHMAYGISYKGWDIKNHPGWPQYLALIESESESISADQINRALNSGPYCNTYPAYNVDRKPGCKSKSPKNCPCIDYANEILTIAVPRLLSKCLSTYEEYLDSGMKRPIHNYIDPKASAAKNQALISEAFKFLDSF